MIATKHKHFTCVKMQWHTEARNGLRDTFFGHESKIAEGVISGKMELFRVNDDSWLVTQKFPDMLFIWCYQGFGLVRLIEEFRAVALNNHCSKISFFTPHKAALRALRRFNPTELCRCPTGEIQYAIECKGATISHIDDARQAFLGGSKTNPKAA